MCSGFWCSPPPPPRLCERGKAERRVIVPGGEGGNINKRLRVYIMSRVLQRDCAIANKYVHSAHVLNVQNTAQQQASNIAQPSQVAVLCLRNTPGPLCHPLRAATNASQKIAYRVSFPHFYVHYIQRRTYVVCTTYPSRQFVYCYMSNIIQYMYISPSSGLRGFRIARFNYACAHKCTKFGGVVAVVVP